MKPGTFGCACHGRRLFLGALAAASVGAVAREGVDVGEESSFARLVPAEQIEQSSIQQYQQILQRAAQQHVLAPPDYPQLIRLRAIAGRIIPHTFDWNSRARQWKWEVNLIRSKDINAFCMPGGKIVFFWALLMQLQLTDDEIAMVMGHEMAHALREHARERLGKTAATRMGASVLSSLFGLGNIGNTMLNMGSQILTLQFSREDESEADLVGMELAARSGYDPRAGVTLWTKMLAANKNAPPEFLSTHPSGPNRIRDIQANLPRVMPLFTRADKPTQRFEPPKRPGAASSP